MNGYYRIKIRGRRADYSINDSTSKNNFGQKFPFNETIIICVLPRQNIRCKWIILYT